MSLHSIFEAKVHHDWLRSLGEFVAVPSVKVRWKRERERWLYRYFDPGRKLREVLPQEIVMEYDGDWFKGDKGGEEWCLNRGKSEALVAEAARLLVRDGYRFLIFDHKGKSPHIHLFIQGLEKLNYGKRCEYKEAFVKKYSADPSKADLSLCSEHLIAAEFVPHFKHGTVKREVYCRLSYTSLDCVRQDPCHCCQRNGVDHSDERGFLFCNSCVDMAERGEYPISSTDCRITFDFDDPYKLLLESLRLRKTQGKHAVMVMDVAKALPAVFILCKKDIEKDLDLKKAALDLLNGGVQEGALERTDEGLFQARGSIVDGVVRP